MWYCKCPICRTEYEHNPKVCTCGFAGLISAQEFAPPHGGEEEKGKAELFSIFKFAKHVLYGKSRPRYLKTLRLPKGIRLEKNALWLDEESPISVEYY